MYTESTQRLEAFEKMLDTVQKNYDATEHKMKQLKGKEKSATYRQLLGDKLRYQNMLSLYRLYGLLEDGNSEKR